MTTENGTTDCSVDQRQRLFVPPSWLRRRLRRSGFDVDRRDAARLLSESDGFAEPFLRLLGAEDVVSVDARRAPRPATCLRLGPAPGSFTEAAVAAGWRYERRSEAHRATLESIARDVSFLAAGRPNATGRPNAPAAEPCGYGSRHGFSSVPSLLRILARQNGFRVERRLPYYRSTGVRSSGSASPI